MERTLHQAMGEDAWMLVLGSILLGLGVLAAFFSAAGIGGVVMGAALYSLGFAERSGSGRVYRSATLAALFWAIGGVVLNTITRHEFALLLFPGEPAPSPLRPPGRLLLSIILLAALAASAIIHGRKERELGRSIVGKLYYGSLVVAAASLACYVVFSTLFLYGLLVLVVPPLVEAFYWLR